jgi:hypothetical protein
MEVLTMTEKRPDDNCVSFDRQFELDDSAFANARTDGSAYQAVNEPYADADDSFDPDVEDIDMEAVPDADAIAPDSPVDPAAPPTDVVHGTDLLNGAGAEDTEDDDLR